VRSSARRDRVGSVTYCEYEMSDPRKHHIVPQLYQKGFAGQQGKGWYAVVLDRARGHARPASNIRDILAERDYNTIIDADGNRDFRAEQMLAEHVETASAPGLEALRAGTFPLSDIDRQQVATFVAAQLTRGRAIRNNFTEALSEVMSMALSLTAQNASDEHFESVLGHPLTAGERERLLHNREHMTIRPTNVAVLRALLAPIADVADLLLMRTWTLVAFPTPCLFTGEHPVVHINPSGESHGYGVATAERLYMPVSTTTALVLSHPWADWPESAVHGTEELARRLNWAMLTQPSNQELLLHPDVEHHPLPSPAELAHDAHWPWGPDPGSAAPIFMHYVSARQARTTAPAHQTG
jgi:Protein of unknown function (DUF4238)